MELRVLRRMLSALLRSTRSLDIVVMAFSTLLLVVLWVVFDGKMTPEGRHNHVSFFPISSEEGQNYSVAILGLEYLGNERGMLEGVLLRPDNCDPMYPPKIGVALESDLIIVQGLNALLDRRENEILVVTGKDCEDVFFEVQGDFFDEYSDRVDLSLSLNLEQNSLDQRTTIWGIEHLEGLNWLSSGYTKTPKIDNDGNPRFEWTGSYLDLRFQGANPAGAIDANRSTFILGIALGTLASLFSGATISMLSRLKWFRDQKGESE